MSFPALVAQTNFRPAPQFDGHIYGKTRQAKRPAACYACAGRRPKGNQPRLRKSISMLAHKTPENVTLQKSQLVETTPVIGTQLRHRVTLKKAHRHPSGTSLAGRFRRTPPVSGRSRDLSGGYFFRVISGKALRAGDLFPRTSATTGNPKTAPESPGSGTLAGSAGHAAPAPDPPSRCRARDS